MTEPSAQMNFQRKKDHILQKLSVPLSEYEDLSPKGTVDVEIRELIDEINAHPGLVTTSSCAGRISVFLEGVKSPDGKDSNGEPVIRNLASEGGKGGGGRWLYISHEPMRPCREGKGAEVSETLMQEFGLKSSAIKVKPTKSRFIHFKFEAMILHILCADMQVAQKVLSSAQQAGFRESGATSIASSKDSRTLTTPMVAVRSTGLALDSIIGVATHDDECHSIVDESYLETLVSVANDRFRTNKDRIHRFQDLLRSCLASATTIGEGSSNMPGWEDPKARRERKIAEGLQRQAEKVSSTKQQLQLDSAPPLDFNILHS